MNITRWIHQWTGRRLRAEQQARMLANLSEWERTGIEIDRDRWKWALWILVGAIAALVTHACLGAETYTVIVGNGTGGELLRLSNVVQISRCTAVCTLVRSVEKGYTNDFHAWLVPITIITNAPSKRKEQSSFSEVPGTLPAEAKAQLNAKGLAGQTQPNNKPLMRNGTRFLAATGKTQNTAGNISDAFLTALEKRESRMHASAVGLKGERGSFQFSRAAWTDVNRLRRARGEPTAIWSSAHHRPTARTYARDYLGLCQRRLSRRLGRLPSDAELIAAWSLGFHGFAKRGFDLSRCPAATRRLLR